MNILISILIHHFQSANFTQNVIDDHLFRVLLKKCHPHLGEFEYSSNNYKRNRKYEVCKKKHDYQRDRSETIFALFL